MQAFFFCRMNIMYIILLFKYEIRYIVGISTTKANKSSIFKCLVSHQNPESN